MIQIIASATVKINSIKKNPKNIKYLGTYRIQNGKPINFTMLYNRRFKTATFTPAIGHPFHKEYLTDMILKEANTFKLLN